jgi:hypothetical protein
MVWQDIDIVNLNAQDKELEVMQELCTYHLEIQGQLEEKNFNTMSPYRVTEVCASPNVTLFTIYADQSGLVGLIRHLHQQGFVVLSIHRKGQAVFSGGNNDCKKQLE